MSEGPVGIVAVIRHSFPKNLRYCRQCIILHAQIESITKRYKYKRYIPRRELMDIVENYQPVPLTVLRWPILRSVLGVRFINAFRVWKGKPCWLTSYPVEVEHSRFTHWIHTNSNHQYVERERFEREVMGEFHVATNYQRAFLWFGGFAMLIATVFGLSMVSEHVVWMYYVMWKGYNRQDMVRWYHDFVIQHASTDFSEAYKDKLPAPCVRDPVDGHFYLQLVELTHPETKKSVLFIPFPLFGDEKDFAALGSIMRRCDGVLLEGIPLENIPTLAPISYFPLKEPFFGPLGLQLRHWRIIEKGKEPPKLYSGGKMPGRREYWTYGLVPLCFRFFYAPWFGTERNHARVGWGRIKEALSDPALKNLAVPWNIHQVTNLEASLLREGWKMRLGPKVRWVNPDEVGARFCDYFQVPDAHGVADLTKGEPAGVSQ